MNHAKCSSGPLRTALILLGAIALAAAPATARARTITVNTLTDEATPGDRLCSLREAINNANSATDTTDGDCAAGTGDDVIDFKVEGTITLTSTLPEIVHTLKIDGGGQIAIDGVGSYQVLLVNSEATLELDDLTIEGGNAGLGGSGGGISNGGTVTITNSTVSGTAPSGSGGGIFNTGTLTVTNSTVSGSTLGLGNTGGPGGGIFNGGTLILTNSTVSNSSAPRAPGGGIFNSGTLTLTNSTVSGNDTVLGARGGSGGGIFNSGTLTLTNSTIAENIAIFGGGLTSGSTTITNSTIAGNSALFGGGIDIFGPTTISNSILADNLGNCLSDSFPPTPPTDGGDNISDDGSCGFATATAANGATIGDNVDPLLDPNGLQNNGGPTQTIALQSTSPAIDAIPAVNCPETDQRGVNRPDNFETACDIGSYEFFDFAGTPGQGDCRGNSISALTKQFGKLATAASDLGFTSVKALKAAVQAFCGG